MRIGVFGGSFDPVHDGHLLLAGCCRRQGGLDRVLFVPAARQPHKPRSPRASDADRIAMLQLACAAHDSFAVSTLELDRGGVSYTVDTLRAIREEHATAELFFLLGADALADLPHWREPAAICELAIPMAVRRPGFPKPDFQALAPFVSAERLAAIRAAQVEMPETPISSSDVQRLIAAGGEWQWLVPPPVAQYIAKRGLYATPAV